MVNALKKNVSPLLPGKYGNLNKQSTRRHHQANEGKSGLEADRVRALGVLHSNLSKKKFSAVKRRETHLLSNEETERWVEDNVDRATAVPRKRVQDAETMIMQEQDNMGNAEKTPSTTRKPEETIENTLNALGDNVSNLPGSDDKQDEDDTEGDEEDTELGKLSKVNKAGWVMGTISKTRQHCMESSRQMQMRLD